MRLPTREHRAFMVRATAMLCDLESTPDFAALKNTPWVFRHAAIYHPGIATDYLREMLRKAKG